MDRVEQQLSPLLDNIEAVASCSVVWVQAARPAGDDLEEAIRAGFGAWKSLFKCLWLLLQLDIDSLVSPAFAVLCGRAKGLVCPLVQR